MKKLPVYIDGNGGGEGHAWVIDGLFIRNKINHGTGITVSTEKLFHINWGWNSVFDGYFNQGVFDTTKQVAIDNEIDSGSKGTENSYFTWNYRTIMYSL
jgi:hypothetical protein